MQELKFKRMASLRFRSQLTGLAKSDTNGFCLLVVHQRPDLFDEPDYLLLSKYLQDLEIALPAPRAMIHFPPGFGPAILATIRINLSRVGWHLGVSSMVSDPGPLLLRLPFPSRSRAPTPSSLGPAPPTTLPWKPTRTPIQPANGCPPPIFPVAVGSNCVVTNASSGTLFYRLRRDLEVTIY